MGALYRQSLINWVEEWVVDWYDDLCQQSPFKGVCQQPTKQTNKHDRVLLPSKGFDDIKATVK